MFYDRFTELCKLRGVSRSHVMIDIGLNKSNATFWKRGSVPKGDTLQKLADYFGVTVGYLLGMEDEPAPPIGANARQLPASVQRVLSSMLQMNAEGQERVAEYADDLVQSGKYIKTRSSGLDKKQA